MITEDKVTELFCIADDFCKFFDAMMEKYRFIRQMRSFYLFTYIFYPIQLGLFTYSVAFMGLVRITTCFNIKIRLHI